MADVATGAVVARAVDGAGPAGHGAHGGACRNCGTALIGAHCHACGQAGHIHRTAGALFHDILHGVFHFEGRTWHTLPLLFRRPGEVTRRYIEGERVKFVSPMALFLFSVFLMGLGTFITVAVLATIAVSAKDVARRLLTRREGAASTVFWWLELLGAMAVFAFGAVLLVASFY